MSFIILNKQYSNYSFFSLILDLFSAVQESNADRIRVILECNKIDLDKQHGQNKDTLLHAATRNGNFNICKILLEHKATVNSLNTYNSTPLHLAISTGNINIFKLLLSWGASVYSKKEYDETSLHIAAAYGHLNLCQMLLQDYNFDVHMTDGYGYTALHNSAESGCYKLFQFFEEKGSDVYRKTTSGENCLHIAARKGHVYLCKKLLENYNFNTNMTDDYGYTPLHYCSENGSSKLFQFLMEMGSDVCLKTNDSSNCLHIAAENGHLNLCETIIDNYNIGVNMIDEKGWTPLHRSLISGQCELPEFFISFIGTDIYCKTNDGRNCLHIVAEYGHLELCKRLLVTYNFDGNATDNEGHNCLHIAAKNGNLNLCKTLLENYNFNIDLVDNDGYTPLHYCSINGSCELFHYLVEMGSDTYLKLKDRSSCLHIAAVNENLSLCKKLIENYKFHVDITNDDGWTPLQLCSKNGTCGFFHSLVEMGSDVFLKTNDGANCLHIAAENGNLDLCKMLLEKYDFDIHMKDDRGATPLHFCALSGNQELFNFFVRMGSDVFMKTNHSNTCLHIAAQENHFSICKGLLENYSFNVNMKNDKGATPLHFCAVNGNCELFLLFIKVGSDVYLTTNNGMNCLSIALEKGNWNLCQILLKNYNFDANEGK